MKKRVMFVAALAGIVFGASAGQLEYWEMNDAVGTDLNDLANSGSLNSPWNFNTAGIVTDGSGNFVVSGDAGTYTRKLPKKGTANAEATGQVDTYATPLLGSAGVYSLELNFSSWNFDAASVGDKVQLKVQDSSQADLANIFVEVDSTTTTRIKMVVGNKSRVWAYGLTESTVQGARVDFDLVNGTVDTYINDVSQHNLTGVVFAGSDIGGMIFTTAGDGTDDWVTAASSVSIDSMGLSVIPEPATLGMVVALGGAIVFIRRRLML